MELNEKTNDELNKVSGSIIDVFEDFLDEKGIVIENEERDEDDSLSEDKKANIYGSDYYHLKDGIKKIIRPYIEKQLLN